MKTEELFTVLFLFLFLSNCSRVEDLPCETSHFHYVNLEDENPISETSFQQELPGSWSYSDGLRCDIGCTEEQSAYNGRKFLVIEESKVVAREWIATSGGHWNELDLELSVSSIETSPDYFSLEIRDDEGIRRFVTRISRIYPAGNSDCLLLDPESSSPSIVGRWGNMCKYQCKYDNMRTVTQYDCAINSSRIECQQ